MNNLPLIEKMLNFSDPERFYFIQVFRRRKDNPGMARDVKVLGNYCVSDATQLQEEFREIKELCDQHHARAYIRLNRRSDQTIARQMLVRIAEMVISDQFNVRNVYWKIAGQFDSESDPSWLVDIDWNEFDRSPSESQVLETIHGHLQRLQEEAGRVVRMDQVPTRNGYHLITRPFNVRQFREITQEMGLKIDVHKDNPTLLYASRPEMFLPDIETSRS